MLSIIYIYIYRRFRMMVRERRACTHLILFSDAFLSWKKKRILTVVDIFSFSFTCIYLSLPRSIRMHIFMHLATSFTRAIRTESSKQRSEMTNFEDKVHQLNERYTYT